MAYFILTDSDWNWDDAEGENGEFGAIIVEADDEQDAALKACERMENVNEGADGGHWKIARLSAHAFVGFEKNDAGEYVLDPTQFIEGDGSATAGGER